jgi:hypothetical protein
MTILNRVAVLSAWAGLAAVVGVIAVMIVGPFVRAGLSVYLVWHRGYGVACAGHVLSEALSPSKRWLAKARLVSCGGVAGGQSVDVVLVPNVAIPLAVRYTEVFSRHIESGMRDRGDHLAVHWLDDHALELEGAPCVPCQSGSYPRRSCDWECRAASEVNGITILLKLTQH